ncbi:alpha/beta hydrolase family protein [Natrinema sp. CGMCC1.2065]|uniref:alpha/beta hydrolase family protein n=1 Tax=Natrinema sp. CGMCC1.2065 TaxID=3445767 RepID=UPI003F4A30C6
MAPRRRTVLAAVSTATASAVAGCAGFLTDETSDDGDDPAAATDVATALVEDLADGRFERASERFRSDQRSRYGDPGRLERLWLALTTTSGSFEEILETEVTEGQQLRAVEVTAAFDGGDHDCTVVIDGETRVRNYGLSDEYERPSYVDPDAITTQSVSLSVPDCSLPGTVTTPAAGDGVPGVVLVHDDGPMTADTPRGGTKTFADLAEGLAMEGVATLRYDKRVPACEVAPEAYTLDRVTVDDAAVAIERLRNVDGVDPDRIVVAGHGLGGRAAPRIADQDGSLAGVVGLAPPARPYPEFTFSQLEYKVSVGSHEWADLTATYETWGDEIDRVRSGEYEPAERLLGKPGAFWDSIGDYDHLGVAAETDVPVLLCQGERDFQVSVADDLEQWDDSFAGATTVETYADCNHLFMPGEGEPVALAYAVRNNVAEAVVNDIATWVREL